MSVVDLTKSTVPLVVAVMVCIFVVKSRLSISSEFADLHAGQNDIKAKEGQESVSISSLADTQKVMGDSMHEMSDAVANMSIHFLRSDAALDEINKSQSKVTSTRWTYIMQQEYAREMREHLENPTANPLPDVVKIHDELQDLTP